MAYQQPKSSPAPSQEKGKKPVFEYRAGGIRASVWENERKNDKGEPFITHSTTITRRYMADGEWKETNSFGVDDLPKLRVVTDAAYNYCVLKSRDPADVVEK